MKKNEPDEFYEEEIYYKDNKPPCKVIRTNEPNLELMARAFRELYYETSLNEKEKTPSKNTAEK
jgi:hypothetical protein